MPSVEHEGVVELFRDNPALGPLVLARYFHADVPEHVAVRMADTQMTELSPVEYRADLVLELLDADGKCVSAIVFEAQLEIKPRKRFTWPAYVAVCRAERECPTALLVVAVDDDVATWAKEALHLGFGAAELRPFVLGPAVLPPITLEHQAREDPQLAVLSAMAHGNGPEGLAVVLAAVTALEQLDTDLAAVYFEVIWRGLREPMQKALEVLLMQRQVRRVAHMPPFIEAMKSQAFHDGEVKAIREKIFRFAKRRQLVLTMEQEARLGACDDRTLLDRWLDNVLEANNADDVFR